MKTAVIYTRCASKEQLEKAIETQIKACTDYAKANGITISGIYTDISSGMNGSRKQFQNMLEDSKKRTWDYVLINKLDRFSRNRHETTLYSKTLADNGVKLVFVTESDFSKSVFDCIFDNIGETATRQFRRKLQRRKT